MEVLQPPSHVQQAQQHSRLLHGGTLEGADVSMASVGMPLGCACKELTVSLMHSTCMPLQRSQHPTAHPPTMSQPDA